MRKIFVTLIVTLLCVSLVGEGVVRSAASSIRDIKEKDSYTFLVCGLDDAAENTDAIIIFKYDAKKNVASFLQIPRDTYFRYSDNIEKLNSVYSSLKAKGYDSKSAMQILSNTLSDA